MAVPAIVFDESQNHIAVAKVQESANEPVVGLSGDVLAAPATHNGLEISIMVAILVICAVAAYFIAL